MYCAREYLVQQKDVERDDQPCNNARKYRRQPMIHQSTHYTLPPGELYKRDKGKWNTKAEDHLTHDSPPVIANGILPRRNHGQVVEGEV